MSMNISQAEGATLKFIGQTLVVDPKQMKESGVEIMHMDSIIDHIVTVLAVPEPVITLLSALLFMVVLVASAHVKPPVLPDCFCKN